MARAIAQLLQDAFVWWRDGLAACIPERLRYRWRRQPGTAPQGLLERDALTLTQPSMLAGTRIPMGAAGDVASSEDMAALSERLPALDGVTIVLSSSVVLVRDLAYPLPAEAELAQILSYDIDRRTPFTLEQVHHTYRVIARRAADNKLVVRLFVAPRKFLDTAITRLSELGGRASRAVCHVGDEEVLVWRAPSVPVPLRLRLQSAAWNTATAVLTVVVIGLPYYLMRNELADISRKNTELRQQALQATQASRVHTDRARQVQKVVEQYNAHVAICDILLELNDRLPMTAWLDTLQIEKSAVTLAGRGQNPEKLTDALDASPVFYDVAFTSTAGGAQPNDNAPAFRVTMQAARPK